MAFKGAIKAGKRVKVTLKLDDRATGEALLFVAAGSADGTATSGRAVVVPAGADDVTITPSAPGVLDIDVDLTGDDDTGQLTVTVSGKKRASARITGDTSWTYAIT